MGEGTTVLQSRMDRVVNTFGRYGFLLIVIILVALLIQLMKLKITTKTDNVVVTDYSILGSLIYILTYFFILMLMLIPTSLSRAANSVIMFSISQLYEENVVWLTKSAPENAGKINHLIIEKGGTLTTKNMKVIHIDTFGQTHDSLDTIDENKRDIIISNLAINVVHLNSVGRIVKNLNNENKHIGSRMECAFLEFLSENNIDYEQIRSETKEILQTNPSTEKRMVMTIIEHPTREGYLRIFLNGSTDVFLTHCNEVLEDNGK